MIAILISIVIAENKDLKNRNESKKEYYYYTDKIQTNPGPRQQPLYLLLHTPYRNNVFIDNGHPRILFESIKKSTPPDAN